MKYSSGLKHEEIKTEFHHGVIHRIFTQGEQAPHTDSHA